MQWRYASIWKQPETRSHTGKEGNGSIHSKLSFLMGNGEK